MIRSAAALAAAVIAVAGLGLAPAAQATPVTTAATAYSAPAATGAANLAASLTLTGAVGGLFDWLIDPIVSTALDPLVSALQSTANGVVSGVLGGSGADNAGTPDQQGGGKPSAFPNETFPSPCSTTSATQPCYSTLDTGVDLAPLARVDLGALAGYTQQTPVADDATNPIFGRARISDLGVTVLPGISTLTTPLVGAGVLDAKANCPADGSTAPSASVSASNVRVLGGLVTLNVLDGAIAGLTVDGTSYAGVAALPVISLPSGITVRSYGSAVRVEVPLTLEQLLAGLQLGGSAVSQLLGDAVSADVTLGVIVGPRGATTTTSAKAWALGVGVDLSGSLAFDLLGLVGARVTLPTGVGAGNLGNVIDLRLAYASCSAPSGPTATSTPAVPPANV